MWLMFAGATVAVACYPGSLRAKEVIAMIPGERWCWGPRGGSREQKTQRSGFWGKKCVSDMREEPGCHRPWPEQ